MLYGVRSSNNTLLLGLNLPDPTYKRPVLPSPLSALLPQVFVPSRPSVSASSSSSLSPVRCLFVLLALGRPDTRCCRHRIPTL